MSGLKSKSRTFNSIRNIGVGFVVKITDTIFPFIIRTIIIHKLGAEYAGVGNLFTTLLQVLSLSELGISSAIIFSLYKPVAENNDKEICEWIDVYRCIFYIIGTIILIIGLCFCPFLNYLIKGDYPQNLNVSLLYVIYLANTVISYYCGGYITVVLTANQRNDIISIVNTALSIIKNFIQIIVLITTSNFMLYIVFLPIFTFLTNLIIYKITIYKFPYCKIRRKPNLGKLKSISNQLKGLALQKIALTMQNSVDSIVLSATLGLTVLTCYSNYYLILSSLTGILGIILHGVSASIGNSVAIDNKKKIYDDHMKFDFYYMFINSLMTICLYILFQPFMLIWVGEKLLFPRITMILFCGYFFTKNMGQIRGLYSEAAGLWWYFRYVVVLEVIENVVLDIWLGKIWGVNGILIATIVTIVINSVILLSCITFEKLFNKKTTKYFINNVTYIMVTVFGCIIANFIFFVPSFNNVFSFIVLGIQSFVMGFIYLCCCYILMPEKRDYILQFYRIVKRSK